MIGRKKKIRFVQFFLFIIGIFIFYQTYYGENKSKKSEILSETVKQKVENQIKENASDDDIFFNIEYSGLDLHGNRYILKSEEAFLDKDSPEIVYMKLVNALFYFKDNTVLHIWADKGVYNNKTLDMKFEINVKANYLESELFAEKAEYSNSESYLSIYENVKVNNINGNLIADKLLFDITNQKLDITSFNDSKINANVKLDEKRF